MNCNNCNNRLCSHYIISDSVTVVTVNGVDTLVIDLPSGTYGNNQKYCIIVRTLPAGVTVTMPVAISIGGVTTTVYPLVCSRTGLQAVGCQVNGRSRIQVCVQTNTTTGVFRALSGLNSYCPNVLSGLPAATASLTGVTFATTATNAPVSAISSAKNKSTASTKNAAKTAKETAE